MMRSRVKIADSVPGWRYAKLVLVSLPQMLMTFVLLDCFCHETSDDPADVGGT